MCHYLYDDLVNQNINFAPIELAAKFSLEHVEKYLNMYGK